MAHGFLTPTPVSGESPLWNDLKKLLKARIWPLSKKQDLIYANVTEIKNILKAGQQKSLIAGTQKALSSAPQTKMLGAGAGALATVASGLIEKNATDIDVKTGKRLPPGGPRFPDSAEPSKGGTFKNIPGIAAPKKLDSEAFFKAAQTGVHPETGKYLSSEERKDYLKKSKAQMNAPASVASAAVAPAINSSSSVTKGDEQIVGSINNLTKITSSLVDIVKAQTATQKQTAAAAAAKADSIASRARASEKEKALEQGTDNSGFLTPTLFGGGDSTKLGGNPGGGAGGGPGFGLGGKVAANAIARRGVGRMATRYGAKLAGKGGAKLGAKAAGKLGLKAAGLVGKKIPLLGLGLGGLFAAGRALKGDWAGAGMELASGAASTIPGLGTAASLGIDAALMAKDAASGNFAGGGLVTGGKKSVVDDVKINADEGEVVMSNAAGNTFGRGNLMAMNAMAGGTNQPKGGKSFAGGGLVGGDKAKSKQMFKMFGEGMVEAQKENSKDFAKIQSQGLKQYYEREGGFKKLAEGLVEVFKGIGGVLAKIFGGPPAKAATGNPADYLNAGGDTSGLASFIGGVESGNDYTKLVGGKTDKNILNKTVAQLSSEKGDKFAMGRYQIQMATAKDVLSGAGIDPSKFKFDEAGQDKLFQLLLNRRGYKDFMSGKLKKEDFAKNLSMEWAALPKDASGQSYWAGVGGNKAHRGWGETLQQLDQLKASGSAFAGSPGAAGTGNAIFGATGNVSNAAGYVHGHFQTNTGSKADIVNDVLPIVKGLLNSGVTDVTITSGEKFTKNMNDAQMRALIEKGISKHTHSGDGRSVDIFVPKGTRVPFPLSDVRNTGGNGGVTGVLPGSGKVWVGHLDPKSKSGGTKVKPQTPNEPNTANGISPIFQRPATPTSSGSTPSSKPSPLFNMSAANPNTGNPIMASSQQVAMASTSGQQGSPTVINNYYGGGGQQGGVNPNGVSPGIGMEQTGTAIFQDLRIRALA